jgi:ribosomal protein L11 methyltransferase
MAGLAEIGFDTFEENQNGFHAYIEEAQMDFEATKSLLEQYAGLSPIHYGMQKIARENWNQTWESNYPPIVIGDQILVKTPFHQIEEDFKVVLTIIPKMSFGTGHHATTFLMIESMEALDFTQKRVIDFGTGTGVLAILAEKMGATKILATDCDDWSINNAAENILANECKHIQLQQAEGMLAPFKADVVLANINLNVIISNLALIHEACHEATTVLFSGLLVSDEPMIAQKIIEAGFTIQKIQHDNLYFSSRSLSSSSIR